MTTPQIVLSKAIAAKIADPTFVQNVFIVVPAVLNVNPLCKPMEAWYF